MTLFQLRSSAVLRVIREFAAKESRGLLLADAVRRVIGATRSLAVFAMVVEATDEKAAVFYRNFGFMAFSNLPLRLFVSASEAAEAVSRALSR